MMPSIGIYHCAALSHQLEWAKSFAKGLGRHGIKPSVFEYRGNGIERDLVVFWGHGIRNKLMREKQLPLYSKTEGLIPYFSKPFAKDLPHSN